MPTKSKSLTTTGKSSRPLEQVPPGEILRKNFLEPSGLTINALALQLRVPATRILAIVKGKRAITADTALRLARYFGNKAEFWLNHEQNYQLNLARREKAETINREVIPDAEVNRKIRNRSLFQRND